MATIQLLPEFREFLKSFNDNRVEYLVIGGFAVGAHGDPRATGDLDVWIRRDPVNADKIAKSLVAFGFSPDAVVASLFADEKNIVRFGVPPSRIEIHTSISGVEFDDAWKEAVTLTLEDLTIPLIDQPPVFEGEQTRQRPTQRLGRPGEPAGMIDIEEKSCSRAVNFGSLSRTSV